MLQEFVPGINLWLEQNNDSSIFQFLNYFGTQFQEAKENIMNQLESGNDTNIDSPFGKILENLKTQINNNNEGNNNNQNQFQPPNFNLNNFEQPKVELKEGEEEQKQEEVVVPTKEDWEDLIIPEARKHLYNQGKKGYEVEEWIRIVQVHLKNGDMMRALSSIQTTIFENAQIPEPLRKFFPKGYHYWNNNHIQ